MFAINCPVHRSRILVSEQRVRSLRNTDQGIVLEVECYCGYTETVRTGRRRAPSTIVN